MTEQNGANFLVSLKNNAEYDKKNHGMSGVHSCTGQGEGINKQLKQELIMDGPA